MSVGKTILTLGYHRRRITPDTHLPIIAEFTDYGLECCYSLVVVFEKKQRFHCMTYSLAVCTGKLDSGTRSFVLAKYSADQSLVNSTTGFLPRS